jgi:hypothetical protein
MSAFDSDDWIRAKVLHLLSDPERYPEKDLATIIRISQDLDDEQLLNYAYDFSSYDVMNTDEIFSSRSFKMQELDV